MGKKTGRKSYFKAGMYLLETLTAGMYNEPLSIYREYIQNAVDSIDLLNRKNKGPKMKVNIDLNALERSITISDSGVGIPSRNAEQILSRIGISDKTDNGLRGFRGIGRFGGIAFSEKATYRTKAEGEKKESIQEWDCGKLREILSDSKNSAMSLEKVFEQTTTFSQENSRRSTGSYFEVALEGVWSFRNHIMDIERVRNYLGEVAPVPFNLDEFSYGREIDRYLSSKLSHYGKYEIMVNGDPVYKPYRDKVKVTKKGFDYIEDINLLEIKIRGRAVAFGWYGQRRVLLGAMAKGQKGSSIRVRQGNLLIGDQHLLDVCFREPRFNSYMIGEIHVDCPDLLPNSRRDDFVDNEAKTLFYNAIEKEIGLPISKEIRLRSRMISEAKNKPLKAQNQVPELPRLKSSGKAKETYEANPVIQNSDGVSTSKILNHILVECKGCQKLDSILSEFQDQDNRTRF